MINNKRLKIGIDYHGVIDHHPDYFASFCQTAIDRGHEIYIITGGPEAEVVKKLKSANIVYNHIFAIVDYYEGKNEVSHFADGKFHIADDLWNRAKGDYCLCQGINIHIDDSKEYIKWFQTPYCLYDDHNHCCYLGNNCKLDLSFDFNQVIDNIENLCLHKKLRFI